MIEKRSLRQKTWGVFIKPYIEKGEEKLVIRGSMMSTDPYAGGSYIVLKGGEGWMLHKTSTSFVEVREIVKQVMDEFGYSINDIVVTEIIPTDHIVTPLA